MIKVIEELIDLLSLAVTPLACMAWGVASLELGLVVEAAGCCLISGLTVAKLIVGIRNQKKGDSYYD